MMQLIVKGNRYEAAKAASARNVPFVFERETKYNETIGFTGSQQWDRVASWFLEDIGLNPPYMLGSLLHYSEVVDPN